MAYPEDMPENWLDVMREDMFDMVISPLHDKDKNPTGKQKSSLSYFGERWHIMDNNEQVS